MKILNTEELARLMGGGDSAVQPLTIPSSPTPAIGLPGWILSVADYLKYLGILAAQ